MKLPAKLGAKLAKGKLIFRKIKPELLTYGGLAVGVFALFETFKAGYSTRPVIDEAKQKIADAGEDKTAVKDAKKQAAKEIAKECALPLGAAATSAAMILLGHHDLRKENAGLMAAYAALMESYNKYREKVAAKEGKEAEEEYYNGVEKDENGDKVAIPGKNLSPYARIFDQTNPLWSSNPELNLRTLLRIQDEVNDLLKIRAASSRDGRGFVFLNEVYDRLCLPRSEAGQFVGWVWGMGDNYIDFGIYNVAQDPHRADFVNGYENAILLDFNVDGDIMYVFEHLVFGKEKIKAPKLGE